MADENENDDKVIQVQVSRKEIYKAVRNVIKNELQLDRDTLRAEAFTHANKVVREELTSVIQGNYWEQTNLVRHIRSQIMTTASAYLERTLHEVVRQEARQAIHDMCLEVVEAVIKDGLTLKLSGNKECTLKVEAAGEKAS